MTHYTEQIAKAASTLSDEQVMDAIVEIDRILAEMTYQELATRGGSAEAHKIVRAALYDVLEARYPWLEDVLYTWVNADDDDRTYTQVVADALTAEYVLL